MFHFRLSESICKQLLEKYCYVYCPSCITDGKETTESVKMPTGVQEALIKLEVASKSPEC